MMDSKIIALIVIAAIGIGAIIFILPGDNNELTVIESKVVVEEPEVVVEEPEVVVEEPEVVVEEPEVEEVVVEENGILSGRIEVTIANLKFTPSEITIKKGTTVSWKQVDRSIGGSGGAVGWHNIVEGPTDKRGDHVFKSKELSFNGGFSYKFDEIGEFEYYCEPHPFMTGKIIVIE
jgi:plastocyanin